MDQNVILFDLDGTLTDSAEGIVNSVVYALEHMGIPYESKESLRCFIGPPLQASFRNVFKLSEEQVQDAVRLFRTYFREKGIYENSVYKNVPEMLSALRNEGYTLAVATSKPEAFAKQILLRFDLAKYFRVIAGATMDGTDKPTVIREALARLEVKPSPRVLMVGDREHDVLGAKEVGIRSLGVLYGYGSEKELSEAGAEYIASTPMDIASFCLSDPCK